MRRFPAEFSSLLKTKTWSQRQTVSPIAKTSGPGGERLRWFPLALRPEMATAGYALLEKHMAQHLRPSRRGVDPASITGMKQNYSEALAKTLKNSSLTLNVARSAATATAREIGLYEMLLSPSLHDFAEAVSGCPLMGDPALQVIRYEAGDYVGPHNDHQPEEKELRDGYVDLQVTFTSEGVARQYLLYESAGYFNRLCNVGVASGIAVSVLPFWHQVTPLEVKPKREKDARRWLLLASFLIDRKANKKAA